MIYIQSLCNVVHIDVRQSIGNTVHTASNIQPLLRAHGKFYTSIASEHIHESAHMYTCIHITYRKS